MKRSSSADRASTPRRTPTIQPFNNVLPARARSASLGLDVRCGCQFFGTDSLLPERQALMAIGRPKARPISPKLINQPTTTIKRKTLVSSARSFSSVGDHEYELVMPPPPALRVTGPNYDRYEPELGNAPKREGSLSSTESRDRKERKFLRIPLDDEMQGLPNDGEGSEDEVMGVEEKEEAPGLDRSAAVPSPGTTTGSRTDLELNTSQVDSSALEDLPLSREARRQQRLEQQAEDKGPGAAARSLQRIRSQAGRLRTKIRNIKRPNIQMPERPRFSMPERPKFNLPDRPKFNLPERPKFNFPDRPKFNMPSRPKFNLPDRPKFNLPERPKFNFPSFSLPRTRRPLRERQQHQESGSSLEVPDQELQDVHLDTPAPSTPGKRNYFDFRTYPRLFDRYKTSRQQRETAPVQRSARQITPPVMQYEDGDDEMDMEMEEEDEEPVRKPKLPPRRRSSGETQQQPRWVGRFTELEYADTENLAPALAARTNGTAVPFDDEEEDEEIQALERELQAGDTEEEHSESLSCFRDKDFGYAVTLAAQGRNPQAPQMIFPDDEEISLQESERDVAHSSGSSSDRRRAGVLEEIDSDEFFLREKGLSQEDIDVGRYLSDEIRDAFRHPVTDTEAILMENATINEAELARTYRGTPERTVSNRTRPPRRFKQSKQRGSPPVVPVVVVEEHFFNTFPPNKPTRNRRRQMREQEKQRKEEASTLGRQSHHVPTAPRRKKRTRSEFVLGDNASQWSEDLNPEWLKTVESQVVTSEVSSGIMVAMMRTEPVEHEYIIPAAPTTPTAPKRGRRQARQQAPSPNPPPVQVPLEISEFIEDDEEEPGYAYVVKPGVIEIEIVDKTPQQHIIPPCTPPPRRMKPGNRPPFPSIRRRRNRPLSGSFTVPHRRGPPTRPSRNYATLGPSRPPRKHRRRSLEDLTNRDLHSGAVIQKMKERPLPAPPRPPRRDRELAGEEEEEGNIIPTDESELQTQQSEENIDLEDIVQHIIKVSASSELIHEVHKLASPITTPEPPIIIETVEVEPEIPLHRRAPVEEKEISSVHVEETRNMQITDSTPKETVIVKSAQEDTAAEIKIETREDITHHENVQPCETISDFCEDPIREEEQLSCQREYDDSRIMSESISTEVTEDCFVPVEEVSVSTQTDPIPEEELRKLEMEQEESCSTQTPAQFQEAPPAPVTPSQPEMSPATIALLQALNAGQLRLELLDVTRLNVNELQAHKLMVSDIDGMTLTVNELQSSGGSLVVNSLDAPMGSLTEAILAAAQQMIPPPPPPQPQPVPVPSTSTSTQCDPEPVLTPQEIRPTAEIPQQASASEAPEIQATPTTAILLTATPSSVPTDTSVATISSQATVQLQESGSDSQVAQTYSTPRASPGPSYYQTPVFTTEQVVALQAAAMSNIPRESSLPPPSDWQPLPPRYRQQEIEPGIAELGSRLARACCTATLAALRRVVTYTQISAESTAETGERGGLQVALCIVLVLVAGLILIGIGGSGGEVHHHHWDFYMPQ